jgi:hypothetical protein
MARHATEFQTIRSEGGLLPPDLRRRVLDPKEKLDGTRPEDYGLPQSERLNEAITQSWNRLRKHWAEFRAAAANLPPGEAGTGLTNDKWSLPLLRELGFGLLPTSAGPAINGRTYPINRFFGPVPIHLIGSGLSLDHRAAGVRGAAAGNPHGLVQEFLNRSPGHLWGMLSNGLRLRVLRDNQALSRQSFLEFDLEAMFTAEVYSDFVLLWLTTHATRFATRGDNRAESCWLEQWTKLANEQGTRALGDLRRGVERALQKLGEGFTSHPKNSTLRDALRTGELPLADFHGQLLRVVYRLIFLFVAEDRTIDGCSLLHPRDDSAAAQLARQRYAAHYSTARLREMAAQIKGSRHGDLWQQFILVVGALSGQPRSAAAREHLALPALGSFLWNPGSTTALNDAELTNHDFLEALRDLAFTRQDKVLRPVDYKNLGAEELGGVYESLLALTPQISADGARFTFAEFAGNERRTSGSYYTPDSLVQYLLDLALDPVVEGATKDRTGTDAEKAILSLRVCDPAVGSGHFLVGAAHRLARHLARVRALALGDTEPSPLLYQHALRDVIGRSLYGVDVNPMAAELCRVSLWLEALEPGKPLSFLDHHIRVGNSLLGATPKLILGGIPDEAFTAMEEDDKKACVVLKKRNRGERTPPGPLWAEQDAEAQARLERAAAALAELPDDRPEEIRVKELAFRRHEQTEEYRGKKQLADAWCAAFVIRKHFREPGWDDSDASGITQVHLSALAERRPLPAEVYTEIERLSGQYQFFHWHLAFPEVFHLDRDSNGLAGWSGGFDAVIGNPPWVRQELLKSAKRLFFGFETYSSTVDSSVLFLERAVQIAAPGRRIGLLTPNKWFRAAYGEDLRCYLRENVRVHLLVDFGHSHNLFPKQDTFPAAVVLEPVRQRVGDDVPLDFVRAHDSDRAANVLSTLIAERTIRVRHAELRRERWQLENLDDSRLLDRLLNRGVCLSEYVGCMPLSGLKAGFNEAYYVETAMRDRLVGDDPECEPLLKRFLRGRDIKRWKAVWGNQWHIVIPSSHNRAWPWSNASDEIEAEAIFAQTYPSVHDHLKRFEEKLRKRADKGKFWWELRACDYYYRLEQPKIVVQFIAYYSQFAVDTEGYYLNNVVLLIPSGDLYLLAILNSRIMWWLMNRTFSPRKDGGRSVEVQRLLQMPVPHVDVALRAEIEQAVRDLLSPGPNTIQGELRLNCLVEEAFQLTAREREIIERSLPPRDPIAILTSPQSAVQEVTNAD